MSEEHVPYETARKTPAASLRVTAVQADLAWEDAAENRRRFDALLEDCGRTDLVVLPEMFSTGFTMAAAGIAEPERGPTFAWMAAWAKRLNAVVTGSIVVKSGEQCFNRLIWMRPDGTAATYDKRHLFRLAGEHEHYAAGRKRLNVDLKGWRVHPLICYDLRFPVWSRRRAGPDDYDLLIYVANWPERRHLAWQTLLQARAIENQCYVIGVNRVGIDGTGLKHLGGSAIHDALGEPLALGGAEPWVGSVTLDWQKLAAVREKLPFHLDADEFQLRG